mmetsp:Transcript_114611/g.263058  ORF Transcript_114611/g.263058 Transcript_114611/m.263058 type:complete len:447 (-) Transcript_114611:1071-2411(-)
MHWLRRRVVPPSTTALTLGSALGYEFFVGNSVIANLRSVLAGWRLLLALRAALGHPLLIGHPITRNSRGLLLSRGSPILPLSPALCNKFLVSHPIASHLRCLLAGGRLLLALRPALGHPLLVGHPITSRSGLVRSRCWSPLLALRPPLRDKFLVGHSIASRRRGLLAGGRLLLALGPPLGDPLLVSHPVTVCWLLLPGLVSGLAARQRLRPSVFSGGGVALWSASCTQGCHRVQVSISKKLGWLEAWWERRHGVVGLWLVIFFLFWQCSRYGWRHFPGLLNGWAVPRARARALGPSLGDPLLIRHPFTGVEQVGLSALVATSLPRVGLPAVAGLLPLLAPSGNPVVVVGITKLRITGLDLPLGPPLGNPLLVRHSNTGICCGWLCVRPSGTEPIVVVRGAISGQHVGGTIPFLLTVLQPIVVSDTSSAAWVGLGTGSVVGGIRSGV